MIVKNNSRLDMYIDEGGDFGIGGECSLLYLVSMVMYDNKNDISKEEKYLDEKLKKIGYKGMMHTAPLIANRDEYVKYSLEDRKKMFWSLFYFANDKNIKLNSIVINKNYVNNQGQLVKKIKSELKEFVKNNCEYFEYYVEVIVYYDKGQDLLTSIIREVFKDLRNVSIKTKFNHENRLFQIADMLTLIDKIEYKIKNRMKLTTSEKLFFTNKELRKLLKIRNKKNHSK